MLGFWGGDNFQGSQGDIDEMIRQQSMELYGKERQIIQQRLELVKSQGAMDWKPSTPKPMG